MPVPRHWSQKRKYLQGKRGLEKPAFKLPDFIEATGIGEMRQAYQEKVLPCSLFDSRLAPPDTCYKRQARRYGMLPCGEALQVAASTTSARGKPDAECRVHSARLHAAVCTETNMLAEYHRAT